MFCAFDTPLGGRIFAGSNGRHYKAGREEIPEDLRLQMPLVRQMLKAMNVPAVECLGYEADDVLATIAQGGTTRYALLLGHGRQRLPAIA